ncbi:MAG TPA: tetratricopeptide repeat protein [Ktedonobacteraceae bacterium]|nr:tetratricopeptide repeat protein [Ktedonobacteraceae bacterium]
MSEQSAMGYLHRTEGFWNMPTFFTSLVGREEEIAALANLLRRPSIRLLTLPGPGGIGKTRLSVQVALEMREFFADGVCFVALSSIRKPERVLPAIAEALSLQEIMGQSVFEQVACALRDKDMLLVLDNFEQVIDAAFLLEDLLSACPLLKLMVTSREILHLQAEHEFPVSPLALPPSGQLPEREMLARYAAIDLFVQRVQTALPAFQLTKVNAPAIAELCQRLDGLPLAIELAAPRVKLLSPQALLARISQRFQVLTGGARTMPVRHQTLQNAIQWSYDLLNEQEQRLFRRLSVFMGGWTLEAAEAVCAAEEHETLLDAMTSLLDKSLLLRIEQDGAEPRLLMLMTMREYGTERLREDEEMERAQRAHATYFLALAEEAEAHLRDAEQLIWLARLEREQENLREALRCFMTYEKGELAQRLCAALWRFWLTRGYLSEGRRWFETVLALPSAQARTRARARALCGAGKLTAELGDAEMARAFLQESVDICRESGNLMDLALTTCHLGRLLSDQGDLVQGRALLEESVALSRQAEECWPLAVSLQSLGRLLWQQNDLTAAVQQVEESLALCRQLQDRQGEARALGTLARFAISQGDAEKALQLWNEQLALVRALNDRLNIVAVLNHLGYVTGSHGDMIQAESLLQESQAIAQEIGFKNGLTQARSYLSQFARSQDKLALAAELARDCLTLFREMGEPLLITYQLNVLGEIERDLGNLTQAQALFVEGLLLTQKVGYLPYIGWHLFGLATLAGVERQPLLAARLFGAVEAVLADEFEADPLERVQYDRQVASVRAQLADHDFVSAWDEGRALTPEQAFLSSRYAPDMTPTAQATSLAQPAATSAYPDELTRREVEVLRLLAKGWTDAQIAEHLVISPRTVNKHTTSIYSKIDVSSRSAATRYALEKKLA